MNLKKDSNVKVLVSGNRQIQLTPQLIGLLLGAIAVGSFGIGAGLFWAAKTFEGALSPKQEQNTLTTDLGQNTQPTAIPVLQSKVEGYAYLRSETSEESNLLRAMSVYLCRADLMPNFRSIRTSYRVDDFDLGQRMRQTSSVGKMEEFAKANCSSPVQTDVNGFYSFSGIEQGNYLVFAPLYGSERNNTPYWLIPINVDTESIKQDINGTNWGIDGRL